MIWTGSAYSEKKKKHVTTINHFGSNAIVTHFYVEKPTSKTFNKKLYYVNIASEPKC